MRVRPPNKEEEDGGSVVQKITEDSLTISGQTFTFDSIADIHSKQARFTSYWSFFLSKQTHFGWV